MPRKMKANENNCECENCDCMEMRKKKATMMGWLLLILGIVLYAKEIGLIPYEGSIWTLGMILVGIVFIVKSLMM